MLRFFFIFMEQKKDMDRYQTIFETWDKLASADQDKFMDLDLYNDTYDRFCELVSKPDANIFELGILSPK